MPQEATSPWKLAYSTTFQQNAPLGSFSGCDTPDSTCGNLPADVKWQWWAYPNPWPDTATQRKYPVGGYYNPSKTIWISGGQMHIRMFRQGGPVNSAAVIPKVAMGRKYGLYVETVRVSRITAGYKSAHLLWPSGGSQDTDSFEVDFPENEWDTMPYGFIHNGTPGQLSFPGNVRWTDWNTFEIAWKPDSLTLSVNGKVTGKTTDKAYIPDVPMDWIIQNESALNGERAPVNSSAQIDIRYVAYYELAGS